MNPLIFSMSPSTGNPIFLQKLISLLTSKRETACGVVTMIAPSGLSSFSNSQIVMCSSEVPGGVSITK
jgi:hypothetical protein